MANRDPMTGVATSAINAKATAMTLALDTKDANTKTTNAQKPMPESSAVFVRCLPLAPSARAGSEKLAVAAIRMITRPTQKNGEGAEELKTKPEVVAKRSSTMATGAPEQTTSGARPAPAASAARSQTLRTI